MIPPYNPWLSLFSKELSSQTSLHILYHPIHLSQPFHSSKDSGKIWFQHLLHPSKYSTDAFVCDNIRSLHWDRHSLRAELISGTCWTALQHWHAQKLSLRNALSVILNSEEKEMNSFSQLTLSLIVFLEKWFDLSVVLGSNICQN